MDAGHHAVGQYAARHRVDVLLVVGEAAFGIAEGGRAADGGENRVGEVELMASRDDAVDWLRHNAKAEDVVLVKASRGAALEWIADQLLEDPTR